MESRLQLRAAARRELALRQARRDFAAFVEYVFGWRLAAHHLRWVEAVQGNRRVLILCAIEHGKTSVLSVAYPLWILGRKPDARIALVSETFTQSSRPLAAIRENILQNPRLREVFPHLKPAEGARSKWTDSEIVVERSTPSKDPSILAVGVLGPLLGARLDLAILDDACGWQNSFTATQRMKLIEWFRSTLVGRIVGDGSILAIGTPWHEADLLHELMRSGEYHVVRDPALDDGGQPLWPEAWPVERLEQRRREIGEIEFSRQMLLNVISDATSRFKASWFDAAFRIASEMGAALVDTYTGPLPTFTGVDLAVGDGPEHDQSALFTLALHPDGRRQVLDIEGGRWQAPELVERIKSAHRRYRSRLRVESNAAQAYIVQFLREDGVPVEAHTTGRNRHHPEYGIESISVEVEAGRWIIPDAPASRTFVRECLAFTPGAHPGDRVVAAWLARESARSSETSRPLPVAFLTSSSGYSSAIEDAASGGTTPPWWNMPAFLRG